MNIKKWKFECNKTTSLLDEEILEDDWHVTKDNFSQYRDMEERSTATILY